MSSANPKDVAHEWPAFSERHWYALAVSLVVVGLILAAFGGSWILTAPSINDMKDRVQIVAPFGTIFLALITFCTVAWRGMVTSRQADQQKRQNDANDEANYAKLLQEAAKLIAEKDKQPQVVAGISTLEILITEPKQRFGTEAMDLLADLIMETYGGARLNRINRAVIRALELGDRKGLTSRLDGVFRRPSAEAKNRGAWVFIPGLKSLSFTGGTLSEKVFLQASGLIKQLDEVRIEGGFYDFDIKYRACSFYKTKVSEIYDYDLERNNFRRCDFSGAIIRTIFLPMADLDLRPGFNFYEEGNQPVDEDGKSLANSFVTKAEMIEDEEQDIPF